MPLPGSPAQTPDPDQPDQLLNVIFNSADVDYCLGAMETGDLKVRARLRELEPSLRFIREKHSSSGGKPLPKTIADMPPETVGHLLGYFEACQLAKVTYLSGSDKAQAKMAISYQGILDNIAKYKTGLENGEIIAADGQPLKIETLEQLMSGIRASADPLMVFSCLLRAGQDAGPQYAVAVSKLLHLFRYQRKAGEEVVDISHTAYLTSKESLDFFQLFVDLSSAPKRRDREISFRHLSRWKNVTPGHTISLTAVRLLQMPSQAPFSMRTAYEEHFDTVVKTLVGFVVNKFYDDGQITDETLYTLYYALSVASLLKFADTIVESEADGQERAQFALNETGRLLRSFEKDIARFLEPQDVAQFFERWNAFGAEVPEPYKTKLSPYLRAAHDWLPAIAQASDGNASSSSTNYFIAMINVAKHVIEDPEGLKISPLVRTSAFKIFTAYSVMFDLLDAKKRDKVLANVRKHNAEGILIQPAQDVLSRCIACADNPCELMEFLESTIHSIRERGTGIPSARILIGTIVRALEKFPDAISKILPWLVPEDPGKKDLMATSDSSEVTLRIFPFVLESPVLRAQFFQTLVEPDYRTHYNACCVAAYMVKEEGGGKGPFTAALLNFLFQSPEDYTNPVRIAVFRNVLERLDAKGPNQIFFNDFWALSTLPEDPVSREKMRKMLGQFGKGLQRLMEMKVSEVRKKTAKEAARAAAEAKIAAPLELLKSLAAGEYPPHDLDALIRDIIENRSIALGDDGRRVALKSSLFHEARVKKNRETGNPPRGLACNVTLVSATGVNVYCRLTIDGQLIIRVLDENNQDLREISRENASKDGISEALFDQLHALALEALSLIYVRKEIEAGAKSESEQATESEPEPKSGPDTPATPTIVAVADLPVQEERRASKMKISLPREEREKMRAKRLHELRLIETNKERVRTAFAALGEGNALPETAPIDLSEVRLFMPTKTNAKAGRKGRPRFATVFESIKNQKELYDAIRAGSVNIDEVWIRISRSFGKPLPYVTHQQDGAKEKQLWMVRKHKPSLEADSKHAAFMVMEDGEEINLAPQVLTLHFDVDFGKDPGALEIQKRTLFQQYIERENPDLIGYYDALAALQDQAGQINKGIEAARRPIFEVMQPGFVFEQTFNYGQFITLRELLFGKAAGADGADGVSDEEAL